MNVAAGYCWSRSKNPVSGALTADSPNAASPPRMRSIALLPNIVTHMTM